MTIRLTQLFWQIGGALMGVAALLSVALPAAAETAEARPAAWQKADALLSGLIETNDPGLAVLVAQDGKILFEKCYGLADREHHVPVIPQTTFRIGSIGKQFTASAILKLQENKKLSVDDKLSKFFPDFPRGDEVTLHHLLTHTSGIHSYTEKDGFIGRVTSPIKPDDLINSFENDPYDFDPGNKWHYNNSGYFLLGRIVEKVSGQSYGDFLGENFFQPLGMTNTGVYHAHLGLPHEALGYSLEGAVFTNAVNWDMSWAGGAGTLYSTVEDLFRWNEGIFNGRVLNSTSLKTAFTPVKMFENQLNSDSGYGFGWFINRHRGLREISHAGGLNGFQSDLLRVPDEKFTVAVLANASPGRTNAIPQRLAQQLVDIFLEDKLAPPPIVNTNVSPKFYDALTGRYGPVIAGVNLTISRRGTHLFCQSTDGQPEAEIFPKSDTEFFSKTGAQITFVKDSNGKVVKMIVCSDSDLEAPRMNDVVEPQKVPQLTLPVQVELEIPLAPVPVKWNGKVCLVYELHVTNFQTNDLELLGLEVSGDGTNKPPLASYSDEELARRLGHAGFRLLPKDILEAFGISPPPGEPEDRIIGPGMRAVIYLLITVDREADVPAVLYHRLTFQSDSPDDKPEVVVAGTPVVVHRSAPLVLGAPIRGEGWLAAGGLSNTSYHRRAIVAIGGKARIPQRFAIDWTRIGEDGKPFRGDPVRNSDRYAYGAEVLAVANAVVADVKDGIPDNEGASSVSGKKAVPITLETVGGNYVILDLGKGNFAFYAHLQPKSIRVRVGQKVRRGQVLALLGNSGNSEGPHLHFHVTNGNSPLGAEGVPYVFESFELQGVLPSLKELGHWKPPANSKADKRRMELPLENAVVRFP